MEFQTHVTVMAPGLSLDGPTDLFEHREIEWVTILQAPDII